ncbi:XrtA/PEP-CTERM system-associated ATPase [Sphingosinicella rhizophila]|uniref:XrtA-associated ATPase n=1 Tax=Sphingosinicella rhizophila TaxID=3050082 RepID=A0ABU3Q2X4_9SPHN|nr:XrtA/PEP-CTERM system-associated ATPase [Sphingosinicella sp. GR2756]MDT9597757.1 XrtA-associated ATPase [Sphingosinicella sp. GR2756]
MYTEHYGLTDRPFQLTPDARFYFESRTHKKAMAYLGYGLAQGEGFIVITGEVGAGKSTLVAHLMATIDTERLNLVSIVSSQVEGDDMLRLAAQGMGIVTNGLHKAQLLERIEQFLAEEGRRGKRTLLIVDEAQNLSRSALEELRMLSNFQSHGRAYLQIFLLGQPEFRDRIAFEEGLEQLRQRVIATHHLGPIEPGEMESYILHRLTVAGWEGRPEFDEEAFAALFRHTGGLPRRINKLANRVLLYASMEGMEEIGAEAVDIVAADMIADRPGPSEDKVLPLRTSQAAGIDHVAPAPSDAPVHMIQDEALARRVASLEARLEEQDVALRRVLTLLVDWVEGGQAAPSYHTNAA